MALALSVTTTEVNDANVWLASVAGPYLTSAAIKIGNYGTLLIP
jgi:hypothetical protein